MRKARPIYQKKRLQEENSEMQKPEDWVVVVDTTLCPHSSTQLAVVREQLPTLRGAILCHENESAPTCRTVPAFPAFCHVPTQRCVSGLRTDAEHFAQLEALIK